MMGSRPILSLSWLFLLLCSTVCSAHTNLEIMKRMLDDMDEKVEPCHNFYNSSQKNLKWHAFATVSDKFQLLFDGIENEVFEKHSFEEKLQRLYKICSTMEGPSLLSACGESVLLSGAPEFDDCRSEPGGGQLSNGTLQLLYNVHVHEAWSFMRANPWNSPAICCSRREFWAGKIFDAIRQQLNIRLERNALELPPAKISLLQKKLNGLSLSIGNLTGKAGHRRFVTRYYKDLEFAYDEELATAHLKVLEHRTRAELSLLDQPNFKDRRYMLHSYPISNFFFETAYEENGNTIYVAYDFLADASFDPDSHDIFKMTPLGIRFALEMLKSLDLFNCKHHKVNMLQLFDDNHIITAGDDCVSAWTQDNMLSQRDQYLVALHLVHEAYFAEGSKFSQRQPNFTTMSLRELFFFRFGQSSFGETLYSRSDFVEGGPPINSLTRLPDFVQAFNCLAPWEQLTTTQQCT
ncbi:GM18038 [Drosophila sechellia]|uniref:GM18038 n=1 Tax=Drosophila sechellia TaxID=7238 RepID=B4I1C6_DROSE|nr:GM18038 [Drosophila sechellia]